MPKTMKPETRSDQTGSAELETTSLKHESEVDWLAWWNEKVKREELAESMKRLDWYHANKDKSHSTPQEKKSSAQTQESNEPVTNFYQLRKEQGSRHYRDKERDKPKKYASKNPTKTPKYSS